MSRRTTKIHAALSFVGIVLGLSGFITFSMYGNTKASVWAFLSALFASSNAQLHLLYLKGSLSDWHNEATLSGIKLLSVLTSLISFAVMVWYCFCWLYYMIPIMPIAESEVIAAVWAFMTLKWGLALHYTANRYTRLLSEEYPPLLPPP